VKFVPPPGGRFNALKIGVLPLMLFNTTMFVRVMLPTFVTVPR